MIDLSLITKELDALWQKPLVEDVSFNGLQITSLSPIERIYGGVDATLDFFRMAPHPDKALFLVHHGLFWVGGNPLITGPMYDKTVFLVQHQSALYASHLPLDGHPVHGNNVGIIRKLLLPVASLEPFGSDGSHTPGWQISSAEGWSLTAIQKRACQVINPDSLLLAYGPEIIHSIAVISGSGHHFFGEALAKQIDLFITGEFDHPMYLQARDYKKNVLMLGHYESERYGVLSIGEYLSKRLSLEFTFIDVSPIFKKNTN
ncbi:MAG: Nif3-like dinuclear metal center hexameric protein [Caldisericia bacterium]|nr:Nif3-like dinuclear metal center hexameric protein [Caldisericia bacterium]